ncbi:MAG TPA: adenylate/guanylate cyclase domain-containing protein [Acidimicrobiia bacterium]|nr:adenylate/guanylate cyclase domain-containing protein [Acidimicrobiia bacterium]
MAAVPDVKFTRSGTVDIAYQVVGSGPLNIVLMIGWVSHLEVLWELPEARRFVERFAAMGRVALFDKRGTGLSDRPPDQPSSADMVPDALAVMDAAGMESAVLVGWIDAASVAIQVAALHPERVSALVLGEALASSRPDEDHPWGVNEEVTNAVADAIETGGWGQAMLFPMIAPSLADDERIHTWFRRLERMSATPSMASNLLRRTLESDVRGLLPQVMAPALVLHRRDSVFIPASGIQWLADHLPNGRYVEVIGDAVPGYLTDVDPLMDEIEDFLLGTRTGGDGSRRVVTILYSDLVDSTSKAAVLRDDRWRNLLDDHRGEARRLMGQHSGRELNNAGDGFLVAFESPSAAIRYGLSLIEASRRKGLEVRVGVHSGEIAGFDGDLAGLALHVGARVGALAGAGEVWVSRTVRDLLFGSEIRFTSTGQHLLKGVPGEWELFRAEE